MNRLLLLGFQIVIVLSIMVVSGVGQISAQREPTIDIEVALEKEIIPPAQGASCTYTFVFRNNGTVAAREPVLVVTFPLGLAVQIPYYYGGFDCDVLNATRGPTLVCTTQWLRPGETKFVVVPVQNRLPSGSELVVRAWGGVAAIETTTGNNEIISRVVTP